MIYEGSWSGPLGLFWLALAAACLISLVTLIATADRTVVRTKWSVQLLVATTYILLALILVDEVSAALSTSKSVAWLLAALLSAWLVSLHLWFVTAESRKLRSDGGSYPVVEVTEVVLPSVSETTTAVYEAAIVESESEANAEALTEKSIFDVRQAAAQVLVESFRSDTVRGTEVAGWPQFLDVAGPPSSIGSAYGLRLISTLDIRDPRVDSKAVVASVLELQRPRGGWSSRSQRGDIGHPEVTAWVLPAILRFGITADERARLVSVFEGMLDPAQDEGLHFTTVASTCLAALIQVAPDSSRVETLALSLTQNATRKQTDEGDRVAWTNNLFGEDTELSTVHTARAVVALDAAARHAGRKSAEWAKFSKMGAQWLLENKDLALFDEPIRRQVDYETDSLIVGHFTPAWVARALMRTGELGDGRLLREAALYTLIPQVEGAWRWRLNGHQPGWMSYQGVSTITEYGLRGFAWPP